MSLVRMVAIEPINGHNPGEDFETSEREANQLEARRLARKAAPVHANKMRREPQNKGNLQAAGKVQPSSASPVGQASVQTTAQPSATGATRAPSRRAAATSPPAAPSDPADQTGESLL